METHLIRRQYFGAEVIDYLTIDGDDTGLNEIIGLTARTDTCVRQELIQTNRLRRVLVLLTVVLLLALGIESVVTLRFEMATLLAVLMKTGTLLIALSVEAGTLLIALSVEAGTRRAVLSESRLFAFTTETRTRPTLPFIVGIKHVFFQL